MTFEELVDIIMKSEEKMIDMEYEELKEVVRHIRPTFMEHVVIGDGPKDSYVKLYYELKHDEIPFSKGNLFCERSVPCVVVGVECYGEEGAYATIEFETEFANCNRLTHAEVLEYLDEFDYDDWYKYKPRKK